jgi:hypothetical protein
LDYRYVFVVGGCLNWSVEKEVDMDLKQAVGISDDEAITMLVAVGHLPERLAVAQSVRAPVEDVLVEADGLAQQHIATSRKAASIRAPFPGD